VRLNLFEEVSALVPNALINAAQLGPVTTIRSATTSVVVRDRQTVVIGGLISDDTTNSESSVPFISDIPVLGNFFRSTRGLREKINLLIFLTPHIIRTAAEHRDKSIEERDKLRSAMAEQGVKYKKRKVLEMPSWTPDVSDPTLKGEGQDDGGGATIYQPPPLPPAGTTVEPGASGEATAPPDQGLTIAERVQPPPRPSTELPEPPPPREGPYRYVLLAAFAEQGSPPKGLQSGSGLIAVALPDSSQLTTLFKPGGQYRFTSDRFDGNYRVLEAYGTAQEAVLMYPEGLPVDPAKGDYLHWREFGDPTSADPTAWSEVQ
jgi:general secretion pathway protein D